MKAQSTTTPARSRWPLVLVAALAVTQAPAMNSRTHAQMSPQMGAMMVDESQASAMLTQRQQMMAGVNATDQKL